MKQKLPFKLLLVVGVAITLMVLLALGNNYSQPGAMVIGEQVNNLNTDTPQPISLAVTPFARVTPELSPPSVTKPVTMPSVKSKSTPLPAPTKSPPVAPKPKPVITPPKNPTPIPVPPPAGLVVLSTGVSQVGVSCPVTTQNCVPCSPGQAYCRVEAGKSSGFKGWACQNNNPGNIRYSSYRNNLITANGGVAACGNRAGYMVFKDYATGRNSLKVYLKAINNGKHTAGYPTCGNCTLIAFFSAYAPSSDGNNPNGYANIVANKIGVDASTTTLAWVVANKFEAFVDAIQQHEGWFVQ